MKDLRTLQERVIELCKEHGHEEVEKAVTLVVRRHVLAATYKHWQHRSWIGALGWPRHIKILNTKGVNN